MSDATAVLAKCFQADLEVVLLVSHCDAIAKEHLHIRGPEGVVYHHVRVVWRSQDLVHELLKGKWEKKMQKVQTSSFRKQCSYSWTHLENFAK